MKRCDLLLLIGVAAALIAASANESAAEALQFDRGAIVAHLQLWRLLTCHIAHWTNDHCFWDALAFFAAAFPLARCAPRELRVLLPASSLSISLWILAFDPEVELYRGLSGVDMALFVFLGASLSRRLAASRSWWRVVTVALLIGAVTAKMIYEFRTGEMLFVDGVNEASPLFPAHVAGAISGLGIWLFSGGRQYPETS